MFINPNDSDNAITNVRGLSNLEIGLVKAYLQGCVYCWCNAKGTEWFKAQYFLGSDNFYWEGTPLFCLYAKRLRYYNGDSDRACKQAGRDAGHLLKHLLRDDKRHFRTQSISGYRWYQWDGVNDEDIIETVPEFHPFVTSCKNNLEADVDSFIVPDT